MAAQFEWRTEEDSQWQLPPDARRPAHTGRQRWPRWLLFGAAAAAAAVIAYWQLAGRARESAASAEAGVMASHSLVQQAARRGDPELLAPVLSGRDPEWTQDQLTLVDQGLFLDRSPVGLAWPGSDGQQTVVTMSADLANAEVASTFTYRPTGDYGQAAAVELRHTFVYRLGEDRWLLSPPTADFWGGRIAVSGRYVTLTYPGRDGDIGEPLAADLEATVAAVCNWQHFDCPADFHLKVELSTNPMTVATAAMAERPITDRSQIDLPAPTLVGKPVDPDGYRLLYRAYASRVAARAMTELVGWRCCVRAVFFQALVDAQLEQLGLKSWPLSNEAYLQALRSPAVLNRVRRLWQADRRPAGAFAGPDRWLAYGLVEFLVSEKAGMSVAGMLRELVSAEEFDDWLDRVTQDGIDPEENTAKAWERFVLDRIMLAQRPPPLALPDEDVVMMCHEGRGQSANIYRLELSSGHWTQELADREFVSMNPLPDHAGVLLTEQFLGTDELKTILWRDGRESSVTFGQAFVHSTGLADPSGRYLILNRIDRGEFAGTPLSVDLATCTSLNCVLAPVDGLPSWSPEGMQTIMSIPYQADTLLLGDGLGQSGVPVGIGKEPFWLDDDTYGYLSGREDPVIVVAATDTAEAEILLRSDDLAAQVGDGENVRLTITHAVARPAGPRLLFITATDRRANAAYLFAFDAQEQTLSLRLREEGDLADLTPISFSPDGRWLLLSGAGQRYPDGLWQRQLLVHAAEDGETLEILSEGRDLAPTKEWSADGRWLLQLGNGYLVLTAPDVDHQQVIRHEFSNCTAAAWIRPGR